MTTETLTLTSFLLARIAEDEDMVRRNRGVEGGVGEDGGWPDYRTYDCDAADAYLERFAPSRVLAECAAKRRIVQLEQYRWGSTAEPTGFIFTPEDLDEQLAQADTPTLRLLAAVYADHADYRDEWR